MRDYVEKVDLEDTKNSVEIETNEIPIDAWQSNSKYELLNENKTKFSS